MKVLHMNRPHQENGFYYLTSPHLPIVDQHNQPCIYKLHLGPDNHKVAVYHLHPNNMDVLRTYLFRIIHQNDLLLIDFRQTELFKQPGWFFIGGHFKDWKTSIEIDRPQTTFFNNKGFLPKSDEPDPPDDV